MELELFSFDQVIYSVGCPLNDYWAGFLFNATFVFGRRRKKWIFIPSFMDANNNLILFIWIIESNLEIDLKR